MYSFQASNGQKQRAGDEDEDESVESRVKKQEGLARKKTRFKRHGPRLLPFLGGAEACMTSLQMAQRRWQWQGKLS